MAALSIRGLDDETKARLRIRAAQHGRSMEALVRAILVEAVREPVDDRQLSAAILRRFAELGGVDLEPPSRDTSPRAAEFAQ